MTNIKNISSKQFLSSESTHSNYGEKIIQVVGIYYSQGKKPCLYSEDARSGKELTEGYHLKIGDVIKVNDARIEIRGRHGEMIRLGRNAEFALEETERGIEPVFYGEIYRGQTSFDTIQMGGKYRTSCWMGAVNYYVVPGEENTDVFFCLSEEGVIWEYDEMGKRFTIVHLDEGQKCAMEYFPNRQMRERYHVKFIQSITDDEYDYITNNFINCKNWRKE